MKPLDVRAAARADLARALDYYVANAPHVARALLAAFRAAFERIERSPRLGSGRYAEEAGVPGLKHRATRRFPYLVFYLELESEIAVLRVLHQESDVPKWLAGREE